MCKSLTIIIISIAGFFVSHQAMAEQVVLTPVMDATLYEEDDGLLANGSGDFLFFGRVSSLGNEKLRRALIKFDVSAIPANARIEAVNLSVEINKSPFSDAQGGMATLHRVTSSWTEGPTHAEGNEGTGSPSATNDVTWLHRAYPSSTWSQAGGDFLASASGDVGYGFGLEVLDFISTPGLQLDVTAWVRNPASNHGWILIGREDIALTARRIHARESVDQNALIPTLTVDYSIPSPTESLALTEITDGLVDPVGIANANDDSGRLFIVEQAGVIRIFNTETQTLLATPYLNITSIVDDGGVEQGLLGLAFHPEFASNRQFYVYYTHQPESGPDRSVVAMYQQNAGTPNVAVNSGTVLLEFEQNSSNHNGGDMHFDQDGYLNIASGDGGGSGDQYQNAQNINSLKGKILRIDVDGSPPGGGELCGLVQNYGIPAGNAFPGGSNGCDEILHLGLRNPWRFAFDAQTEELFIGDVGQVSWEEVDYAPAGASGLNFGWPCREGLHAYPPPGGVTCPSPVDPILEYQRVGGGGDCAITGGYVYRGSALGISGYYVYGDYCTGKIWLAKEVNGTWTSTLWTEAAPTINRLSAFGQDQQCELYVADPGDGKIYRIDDDEMVQRSGFEALRCQ